MGRRVALALALLIGLAGALVQAAGPPPLIAIFTSREDAFTQAVVDTFSEELGYGLRINYGLSGSQDDLRYIRENLAELRPSLVLAVGDRALKVAAREFADAPVLYLGVNDEWVVIGHEQAVGLPNRASPTLGVPRLKQAAPTVRRIGAVRALSDDWAYWSRLEKACEVAGLTLEIAPVADPGEIPNAVRTLARSTDLLWLQPSPSLWSGGALAEAMHEAHIRQLPVLGFDLAHLAGPQPAAMVLAVEPEDLGGAAAEVAGQILREGTPADLMKLPWVEPRLYGNLEALRIGRIPVNRETELAFDGWVHQ